MMGSALDINALIQELEARRANPEAFAEAAERAVYDALLSWQERKDDRSKRDYSELYHHLLARRSEFTQAGCILAIILDDSPPPPEAGKALKSEARLSNHAARRLRCKQVVDVGPGLLEPFNRRKSTEPTEFARIEDAPVASSSGSAGSPTNEDEDEDENLC